MRENNGYFRLKQLSILMALDTIGEIIFVILLTLRILLFPDGSAQSVSVPRWIPDSIYANCTIEILRIVVLLAVLISLPHLSRLSRAFEKARTWYLLRILASLLEILIPAVFLYHHPMSAADANPQTVFLVIGITLVLFITGLLGDSLFLSLGNRNILYAGAVLLESCGFEKQAQENRRCGKTLVRISAAQLFFFALAAAIPALVWLTKGKSLFSVDFGNQLMALLDILLILLYLLFVILTLLFRLLSAVRMGSTYRLIEELTK